MDRLTALRAFVRLAELGTFSATARDLRVGQSTVSKWISALEDEVGAELFQRTTRSVRLTAAGKTFIKGARDVLAAYEIATEKLQSGSPSLRGRLRMSVPVVFGRLFIVPQIRTFMRRHPEIEIEMVFSDRYINLIGENVDVAVRVGTPIDSSLRSHALGSTARHAVASPGYVERCDPIREPDDLRRHPCLLHTELSRGDVWQFRKGPKKRAVTVKGRFSANNSEALLALARSGQGIAMLAHWLVEGDLRAGKLVALLSEYALPRAPIAALTPPSRHTPPKVTELIAHLKTTLGYQFRAKP